MAGTTPKRLLPYPSNADAPNVAGDINALATAVDTQLGAAGKFILATEQTRTNVAYGTLTTPDQVSSLVLTADSLVRIAYFAVWKRSAGTANAAIFLGANQLKFLDVSGSLLSSEALSITAVAEYGPLLTGPIGLEPDIRRTYAAASGSAGAPTIPTTGVVIGGYVDPSTGSRQIIGGGCQVFLAAGTYDVSVQFKCSGGGTVSVRDRHLWVNVQP